jgi:hypothetical protein
MTVTSTCGPGFPHTISRLGKKLGSSDHELDALGGDSTSRTTNAAQRSLQTET